MPLAPHHQRGVEPLPLLALLGAINAAQASAVRVGMSSRHDFCALPLTIGDPQVQSHSSSRLGEAAVPGTSGIPSLGPVRRHRSCGCAVMAAGGSPHPVPVRGHSSDLATLSRIVQLCTRGRPLDVAMAELKATRERLQGRGKYSVPESPRLQREVHGPVPRLLPPRRSISLNGQPSASRLRPGSASQPECCW